MTWTRFYDLHSGGGQKQAFSVAYVEADVESAIKIFEDRFSDPNNVTCDCCGEDYSISEYESLEDASAYARNCAFTDSMVYEESPRLAPMKYGATREECVARYMTLEEYVSLRDVLVVYKEDLWAG